MKQQFEKINYLKGKSPDYKSEVPYCIQKLKAIFYILKYRNFILLTNIKEFEKDGERGRRVMAVRRTDYGGYSDYLSCLAGAEIVKKQTDKTTNKDAEENI